MGAPRWQRAKDVFQAALTRPPEARAAFLDDACGGDAELRQEIQELLVSHGEAGGFLSRAAGLDSDARAEASERAAGAQRIGPYLILDTIAHGGMGTVYRAARDDDTFRKTVALKLIRGGHGSEFIERRFRQERQILARLQHPNIAAVFDGGTTDDGQPYLVMEHVEGRPVTEFCTAGGLGTRERLALFQTVCGAVQYAHQNLVIHRDLKPDNILVTREGVPKLLDFGIAKLLAAGVDPEEAPTATLLPMMTPEYASPEQVKGEAVTTASDVYSLGVLLYELLAGRRPYALRTESMPEIVRMVCETEPPLPSAAAGESVPAPGATTGRRTARSELRGDLDTIVMKALRKEPSRRYPSVQELSTDIRRHLEGLPVLARPDTLRYRASKFVARHTAGVTAATLVFVSLVGAVVMTTRQARIAERRFQDTRRIANALVSEVHNAIQNIPGTTAARALIVKRGLEYLDRLASEPEQDRALRLELSTAYVKMGDAQGLSDYANLGDSRGALQSYGKALAIRERLSAEAPSDTRAFYEVGVVHNRIGVVLRYTGDVKGAVDHHREALRIAQDSSRALGADAASRRRIVVARYHLAEDLLSMGRAAEALREGQQGLAIAAQLLKENPGGETRRDYGAPLEVLGDALAMQGDHEGALARFLEILAINEELAAADAHDAQAQLEVVTTQGKVAGQLAALGRLEEASRQLVDAIRTAEELAARDAQDLEVPATLADTRIGYADLLQRTGQPGALDEYEKALLGLRKVTTAEPSNLRNQGRLATLLLHKGEAELAAGRTTAARGSLAEGSSVARALAAKDPARSGSGDGRCEQLREAVAAWAKLEGGGPLTPTELGEQRAVVAAADACSASHSLVQEPRP